MIRGIPRATASENARFTLTYTLPNVLRGTFISRPLSMRLTTRLDVNRRAAALVTRLQDRHGGRSVLVRGLNGDALLVLSAEDARRVLQSPADLYSLDTPEKQAGLGLFQPDSLILSRGELRTRRRRFNEAVLDTGKEAHRLGERFLRVLREEIPAIIDAAEQGENGELGRTELEEGFRRVMRRCVFGDAARDDAQISMTLAALRGDANWMGLKRWARGRDARLLADLDARIRRYIEAAEPGTLVSLFGDAQDSGAQDSGEPDLRAARQVSHWMMAFDAVRVGVTQTLALLATHPAACRRALEEVEAAEAEHGRATVSGTAALGYLRACFWEGVRLWAPVPTLMRVTTAATSWYGSTLPAGSSVLIPTILSQRDRQVPFGNRFAPDAWLDGTADASWWIAPFARGEGQCPGRDLGLLLGTASLAELLRQRRYALLEPRLRADRPLPATINPQRVRFAVRERPAASPVPRPSQDSGSRTGRTVPSGPAAAGG